MQQSKHAERQLGVDEDSDDDADGVILRTYEWFHALGMLEEILFEDFACFVGGGSSSSGSASGAATSESS